MPVIMDRIRKVKEFRLNSRKPPTRDAAQRPTLFAEIRQPENDYIIIPLHSSENRQYIPLVFFDRNNIVANSCSCIPNATIYHFGVLTSAMHMAWVKFTCGRIKSDYRYSNKIVYNNYPWPKSPSEKQLKAVEDKAQTVLDVRAKFSESSLADLYDPLTMPPELLKAHNALDKAVDLCYRPQAFPSESNRIEYLFGLYSEYTRPLMAKKKTRKQSK